MILTRLFSHIPSSSVWPRFIGVSEFRIRWQNCERTLSHKLTPPGTQRGPMAEQVDPPPHIRQRRGNDCDIAATATVIGRKYEEVARAFEIPIDGNGMPDTVILGPGIPLENIIYPLLELGWLATPLISRDHPKYQNGDRSRLGTSQQIRAAIAGRKAILGYRDSEIGDHSLAWTGKEAIDCSNGQIVNLDSAKIFLALILSPAE